MTGRKETKLAIQHTERHDEAATYRGEGHSVYAYLAKTSATWSGGLLPEMSQEIEAIESAGWRLDNVSWSAGQMILLIFRAVPERRA